MLVESLSRSLHDALTHMRSAPIDAETEAGIVQLLAMLEPHAAMTVDDLTVMFAKVKKPKAPPKPKKTAEEKLAEATEKAAAKVAAKQAKADEKAAAKTKAANDKIAAVEAKKRETADAKLKKAADKIAAAKAKKQGILDAKAKVVADRIAAKDEKKKLADDAKLAKKEAAAAAKLAEKAAKKEAAATAKLAGKVVDTTPKTDAEIAAEKPAVDAAVARLNALMHRFRGGNVPEEAVTTELVALEPLNGPQLFRVAKAVNSDATLTEHSPKPKILTQIREMILQVWKTSDNVNH